MRTSIIQIIINGKNVDPDTVQVVNIRSYDAPDYVDAYVESAEFEDGTKLTDEELDEISEDGETMLALIDRRAWGC